MLWQDLTWPEIDRLDRDGTIVLLPVGSVEQHGLHMPTGTDTLLASAVSTAAASQSSNVVVLPPPWYGLSAHHLHFPGTVSLSAKTMMALVEDIVASVVVHRFRRIVIVNGHGGNGGVIDVLAATLGHRFYGRARIAALSYFLLARDAIEEIRVAARWHRHACEFETSVMKYLRPDLVHPERAAVRYPDTGSQYLSTDLVQGSAVRSYMAFDDLSETGTCGDPSLANVEKGERFFLRASTRCGDFWMTLHAGRSKGGSHGKTESGSYWTRLFRRAPCARLSCDE